MSFFICIYSFLFMSKVSDFGNGTVWQTRCRCNVTSKFARILGRRGSGPEKYRYRESELPVGYGSILQRSGDIEPHPVQCGSDHVQGPKVAVSEGDVSRILFRLNLSQQLAFR